MMFASSPRSNLQGSFLVRDPKRAIPMPYMAHLTAAECMGMIFGFDGRNELVQGTVHTRVSKARMITSLMHAWNVWQLYKRSSSEWLLSSKRNHSIHFSSYCRLWMPS